MGSEQDTDKLGRYDIVRVLGKGAMGVVYEGRDPNLDRRVAIKTIRVQNLAPQAAVEYNARFRTEARSAARLSHPNIVNVFDSGQDQATSYLVMEFIQGNDLKHHLSTGARFSIRTSIAMVHDLLMALDHAHSQNVVHRDIKPANLLIEPSGRIKLTDFGVARIQDSDETNLTQLGSVVGTPKYMSPEQAQGQRGDSRSDIFSTGVVLYELLAGKQPFDGDNQFMVIHQIVNLQPALPSTLNPQLPLAMNEVLARAMAKNPDERYATAREFALALRSVAQHIVATEGTQPANGRAGFAPLATGSGSAPPAASHDGSSTGIFGPSIESPLGTTFNHEAEQAKGNAPAKQAAIAAPGRKNAVLYASLAGVGVAGGVAIALLAGLRPDQTAKAPKPASQVAAASAAVPAPAPMLAPAPTSAPVQATAVRVMQAVPASKPVEKRADKRVETPAEKPVEKPVAERPAKTPAMDSASPPQTLAAASVKKTESAASKPQTGAQSALEQYHLGRAYLEGQGIARNVDEALRLYRLAAAQGLAQAQAGLGVAYNKGEGVPKDRVEALRWFRLAADQGYAPAQAYMARAYFNGLGVQKDDAEAVRWARMAAEKGDADGQFRLGLMLHRGQGIAQDNAQAIRWVRLSADQGNGWGQSLLGYMTFHGLGVASNVQEALRLYRLSAAQGNSDGQNNLGWMYASGQGVTRDDVEAVRLYRLSAEQSNFFGQTSLADMLYSGRGVKQDKEQALKLYRLAAAAGYERAAQTLRKLAPTAP